MKTFKLSNIEVSEEEIRKVLRENPELVKETRHKRKFFESQEGDNHWKLTDTGYIKTRNYKSAKDKEEVNRGVYFTEQEVELADKKRIALKNVWNWADDNVPFTPDWSDNGQLKWSIHYDYKVCVFGMYSNLLNKCNHQLPHFASNKDAQKFITACESDLKILFDIK